MYILKSNARKSVKISVKTIAKITGRNTGIQNVLNCQIRSIKKMSAKVQNFSKFLKNTFEAVCLGVSIAD